jgi:hypothetical protein
MKPLAIICMLALSACAAGQTKDNAVVSLASFAISDLQAAQADAEAHGDQIATACYPALITFVTQLQSSAQQSSPAGTFSGFQRARDAVKDTEGGVPVYLRIGCAALVQDVTSDVAQFLGALASIGVKGAAIAAGKFVIVP